MVAACFSACCKKVRKAKISRQQLKIYFALFMAMFGSSYSITMMFPFLPFMVQFLLPDIDSASVGKYAGMVASAMFLGRFLGSYAWGALCDVFGYKRVLIACNLLLGLAAALFGLSVNFPMAIAMRLLLGLVNGAVGNSKAAMAANTNNENQALGMSILASSYGLGIVIGPAISGAIADPIGQYDLNITDPVVRNLLTKFPYSLACFANTLLCIICAICVIIFLPGQQKKPVKQDIIELSSMSNDSSSSLSKNEDVEGEEAESTNSDMLNGSVDIGENNTSLSLNNRDEDHDSQQINSNESSLILSADKRGIDSDITEPKTQPTRGRRKSSFVLSIIQGRRDTATLQYIKIPRSLVRTLRKKANSSYIEEEAGEDDDDDRQEEEEESEEDSSELLASNRRRITPCSRAWWAQKVKATRLSFVKSLKNFKFFLSNKVTRMVLFIYCIFSFAVIGFEEIYPLWCATPAYSGGLGFTLSQIGTSLSVVGIILLTFSLVLYPSFEKKLGTIKTLTLALCFLIFLTIITPNIHFLVPIDPSIVLWVCLCVVMLFIRASVTVGFSCTGVLINNSVPMDKLGAMNGLALMLTSAFRVVSPLFSGSIYSLSLSEYNQSVGFPLNYHLIFITFGIIYLLTLTMLITLPESINRQMVVTNVQFENNQQEQQV